MKGDARKGKYHIERKTTARKSFSITGRIYSKLLKEVGYRRTPILAIRINDNSVAQMEFIVMPLQEFQELTGEKVTI